MLNNCQKWIYNWVQLNLIKSCFSHLALSTLELLTSAKGFVAFYVTSNFHKLNKTDLTKFTSGYGVIVARHYSTENSLPIITGVMSVYCSMNYGYIVNLDWKKNTPKMLLTRTSVLKPIPVFVNSSTNTTKYLASAFILHNTHIYRQALNVNL